MLLYSQFYTENHVFSLRINTCFLGVCRRFYGRTKLIFFVDVGLLVFLVSPFCLYKVISRDDSGSRK